VPHVPPITDLLKAFAAGDKSALDRLIPLVYSELRRLANAQIRRERNAGTLQPTALVHEAYVRLVGQNQPDYESRGQFLGIAAQVMRQVLVDHARARNASKRGGGLPTFPLKDVLKTSTEQPVALLDIDQALRTLERRDPQKARLLEMRFFGGLNTQEISEALGLSPEEVLPKLRVAHAWLRRLLEK
jgi:RNA polymerase sigma factor (TIGR02999 family)